ncbi:MAG: DUF1329 domain-containing protein [Oceanococcus sp.]
MNIRLSRAGLVVAVLAGLTTSPVLLAKASAEDIARLGKDLTLFGAEKAGNEEGTIPEYTGGLPKKGNVAGQYPVNPQIEAEQALFTITQANMSEYLDKLTVGHQELLRRYPDTYKINVYKTHRTVSWPKHILDATQKNASTATLIGTDAVKGAVHGLPFPIPGNAAEIIWNHKTRWRGHSARRYNNQAIVQLDGSYQISKLVEDVTFPYTNTNFDGKSEDILLYYLSEILAPPRNAGQLLLVHETSDQTVQTRNAWIYNPGLRRTRRAPNVSYDNPYEGTDGNQFNDQVDMYNGAMDRYRWKLIGKKEMYIPYNSYRMGSPDVKYDEIISPRHVNPDLPRFELRRVWIVDSTLREGTSHTFGRRTFYVEEDSWAINSVDCYDRRGGIYKFQEAHQLFTQNVQAVGGVPELIYDFQSGRYFMTALANEDKPNDFSISYSDKYFTPRSLRKKARR